LTHLLVTVAEPHKLLGKNVVRLRAERKITQEALAESAGISHRYLQSIEAGTKQPSINVVARLHTALGSSWDDLLKGL
jgi:transcriptional regulator with XRE-family HTH domain